MDPFVGTLNTLVGYSALLLQIGALVLFVVYAWPAAPFGNAVSRLAARLALPLGLFLTLGAIAMSLYYSEVLGFIPCGLCWLMRVFLYPQAVIFAVAWWRRDNGIAPYAIALSLVGILIGLYQHYLQMGGGSTLPCPATPGMGDCASRIMFELGYITFPLVGVSLMVFLVLLMVHLMREERQKIF